MEIFLIILILALIGYSAYKDQQFKIERIELTRAIMARNLTEYDASKIIKEEPKKEEEPVVEATEASDREFERILASQTKPDEIVEQ